MNNKYIFLPLFIVATFTFIIAGCSNPFNIIKGPASFEKDMEAWEKVDEQLRQQYLGMSKESILVEFGKPIYTNHDCPYNIYLDEVNKKWVKGFSDECMAFRRTSGIPIIYGNVWSIMFYFKNDVVVWVKVN